MNLNISYKIQNVRSLNLSQGIDKTRKKIDAQTHESNDVIFIINAQVGQHKKTVQREFLTCKNGQYITFFNSNSSRAAVVGIAIRHCAKIDVLDIEIKGYQQKVNFIAGSKEDVDYISEELNSSPENASGKKGSYSNLLDMQK